MKKTALMKNYLTKGIKMYLFFKFRKNKPLRLFRNLLFFIILYVMNGEYLTKVSVKVSLDSTSENYEYELLINHIKIKANPDDPFG